jgi:hypothetical protein
MYSFGGKNKDKYNENPGPGSYDAHNNLQSNSTRMNKTSNGFGTSKREG